MGSVDIIKSVAEEILDLLEKFDSEGKYSWLREHFQQDGDDLYSVVECANAIGMKIGKSFYADCISVLDLEDADDREIKEHLDEMLIA